jgi:plastocyanin
MLNTAVLLFLICIGASSATATDISGRVIVRGVRDSRDAVVYIDKIPGKQFAPPSRPVTLDQKNLTFVPHVLPVLAGTRVAFPNSDEIRHNVFSPTPSSRFTLGTYASGESRYQVFDKPGPVTLLCNVHAEMSAYVIVVETPYFATTDKEGKFTIPNVPSGRYVLRAWHERSKPGLKEIDVPEDGVIDVGTFELKK